MGIVYGVVVFMVVFVIWIYYFFIIIYIGVEFIKVWVNEMGGKIFFDEYVVVIKIIEIYEDKFIE